jgi:hypothetical protein
LTAFEAVWLWLILDTCGEIAIDTLPYVGPPPRRIADDPSEAWERILDKFSAVTPPFQASRDAD